MIGRFYDGLLLLLLLLLLEVSTSLSLMSAAGANENPATMIRGVGVFRQFRLKPGSDVVKTVLPILVGDGQESSRKSDNAPPERATVVYTTQPPEVVLVEEWENSSRYSTYEKNNRDNDNDNNNHALLKNFLLEPPTYEYFPESLHIYQDDTKESTIFAGNDNNIGILVRQKTSSKENGCKLRDAQKEAYEHQMQYEPNCTCCIILSGSSNDPSQVRIIELWKTMDDFYFHESSWWHSKGEEKVVPLVIDMDCDFCYGRRITLNDNEK